MLEGEFFLLPGTGAVKKGGHGLRGQAFSCLFTAIRGQGQECRPFLRR